jgi:hypothetical protein
MLSHTNFDNVYLIKILQSTLTMLHVSIIDKWHASHHLRSNSLTKLRQWETDSLYRDYKIQVN